MVHIPIHNQDSFEAVLLLEISGGNGNIIEKTKAQRFISLGVVTRGTN